MNAPLPAFPQVSPSTFTEVFPAEVTPKTEPLSNSIPAPTKAPIDADIENEAAQAEANRKATVLEIIQCLLLSPTVQQKKVTQPEFMAWLSGQGWPEEQVQKVIGGEPRVVKLFKGHDGFAVKVVPVRSSGQMDGSAATYYVNMYK